MLTSHQIDELEIIWIETPHYAGTQVLNTSPKTRVIRDFFLWGHWSALIYMVRAFAKRKNFEMNESGFRFEGNELDWDEEPFEGVELYDPFEDIYLEEADFYKLVQQFLQAVLEGATHYNTTIPHYDWWEEFVELAKSILNSH